MRVQVGPCVGNVHVYVSASQDLIFHSKRNSSKVLCLLRQSVYVCMYRNKHLFVCVDYISSSLASSSCGTCAGLCEYLEEYVCLCVQITSLPPWRLLLGLQTYCPALTPPVCVRAYFKQILVLHVCVGICILE